MNLKETLKERIASPAAVAAAAAAVLWSAAAWSMVNPQFQPSHLVGNYKAVIGAEIAAVDSDKGVVTLRVTKVCMGQFAPKDVTIEGAATRSAETGDDDATAGLGEGGAVADIAEETPTLADDCRLGAAVVAYVGKSRKGHEGEILVYANHQWHDVRMIDVANPSKWKWRTGLGDKMYGTFNGAADRLLEMMADAADGRMFFPPIPFTKFKDDQLIGKFEKPLRGVALYDIDGDGKLDIYACSEAGNRAYIQTGPLVFEDRTATMGLDGVKGQSVSFADTSADGRADLLADGVLYLQGADGKFARSDLLPPEAAKNVKCSAFFDINGDGYPDVIVSRVKGGLALYLNPGAKGGPFIDATAAAGLDKPECGTGGTGFFAAGDYNGDGRADLYYGVDKGLLLLQNEKGVFASVAQEVGFNYELAANNEPGMTGAGAFASVWQPGSSDIAVAGDMQLTIADWKDGKPENVTGYGNETQLCVVDQLGTLPEDLNMDGNVDLLTLARGVDDKNTFHSNRNYGSFMVDTSYESNAGFSLFPGDAFEHGAWGAAAGDVDGDGANDLVLAGVDGHLVLLVSDTLSLRKPQDNPLPYQKILEQTVILTVKVTGKLGVCGATVTLADSKGRVVGKRVLGSQILTGCCGPNTVNLAVREPDACKLTVRFSDGLTKEWSVDLTKGVKHVTVDAARPSSM